MIHLLDFVCAKVWQILATVSPSVHLVRSTKTRLSLSHHARSTLRDQAANTNFDHDAPVCSIHVHVRLTIRTALALQHLVHARLAVRASNHIDTSPPVNPTHCQNRDIDLPTSTNISFLQRTSSCIPTTRPTPATRNNRLPALLLLDQHQLPVTIIQLHLSTTRPTSATRDDRPATHTFDSTIPATDITHLAEDTNTTTPNFSQALVNTTINCHLCYICYLAFVSFIVFGCHYSHALNLNHLRGRHANRLCKRLAILFINATLCH